MSNTNSIQSAKDTNNSSNKYGQDILDIYNDLNGIKNGKTGGERIQSAAKIAAKIIGAIR